MESTISTAPAFGGRGTAKPTDETTHREAEETTDAAAQRAHTGVLALLIGAFDLLRIVGLGALSMVLAFALLGVFATIWLIPLASLASHLAG